MLRILVVATMMSVASAASSAEPSAEFTACMDASGGVTASMLDCLGVENERVDAALNALWQSAFPQQSDDLRGPLRASQRAWITYRDTTCDFEAAQYDGGSFANVARADCYRQLNTDRLDWLGRVLAER